MSLGRDSWGVGVRDVFEVKGRESGTVEKGRGVRFPSLGVLNSVKGKKKWEVRFTEVSRRKKEGKEEVIVLSRPSRVSGPLLGRKERTHTLPGSRVSCHLEGFTPFRQG